MSTTASITKSKLADLVARLVAGGARVIAPVRVPDARPEHRRGRVRYRPVTDGSTIVLDATGVPDASLKSVVFPPTEPLYSYAKKGREVELTAPPLVFQPTVVLAARPCDAAGLDILDHVMGWDLRDELWFGRRKATTVVALACTGPADRSCFCTAVGLGPDATRGSDALLVPENGGFAIEAVTEAGEALIRGNADLFGLSDVALAKSDPLPVTPTTATREQARRAVAANLAIDPEAIRAWLGTHFEDALWDPIALRCHGCGACASVCPTCHCFDVVDEPESLSTGTRRRNWDTCQAARFTLHASGHNPRGDQNARFRQRVMHKFEIYPQRFGPVLCTGCGRCSRACPGGQDLPEVLSAIQARVGGAA